jgi:MFS family permease
VRRDTWAVLSERPFRLLWLARTTSSIGDALVPVATSFAVLHIGSASDLGVVLAVFMGSRTVFIVAGGVWGDRLPRQVVMLAADLVRAATQAAIAVAFLTHTIEVWNLVVSSALLGGASAFFGPASTGLLPQLVSRGRIQQANALIAVARNAVDVFGPALSGILVATVGYEIVFALDAASFAGSALFLCAMRLPARIELPRQRSFVVEVKEGAREILARTWLWSSFVNFALSNLAMAPYFVLGPLVVQRELGGAQDWGVMMTAGAVGGIVGGAIALRIRPSRPLLVSFPVMLGVPLQLLALVRPLPLPALAVGAALFVFGIVAGNTIWQTVVQQQIPNEKLARVDALDWMVSLVFMPLGYVVAGPLAARIGVDRTLVAAACVGLVAELGILAVPSVRAVRRLDPGQDARPATVGAPAA